MQAPAVSSAELTSYNNNNDAGGFYFSQWGHLMKEQTHAEPKILAAAERQMQAHSLAAEIADRLIRVDRGEQLPRQLGDYITISREAGAGAEEIAELVGVQLHWEVLDKNLLDRVADRYKLSRQMLELVDETQSSWAYDVLGTWLDPKIIPHEKYFVHVARTILNAARRGKLVLVGRGGQFLLPRDQGLAVRIIASEGYRVEQIVRRHNLSAAKARALMAELDNGRRQFIEQFFHHDVADPHFYDLVINVDHLGTAGAAAQIVEAYNRRAG